jgi:hypothetical protein
MSKFIFAFALLIIAYSASAQAIIFDADLIDYGKIERNSDGQRVFTFTNTGTKPLIIENVIAGCSCSIASYSDKPILPNERGEITVTYDTKRTGRFTKRFTMRSNAENANKFGEYHLTITGEVLKAK